MFKKAWEERVHIAGGVEVIPDAKADQLVAIDDGIIVRADRNIGSWLMRVPQMHTEAVPPPAAQFQASSCATTQPTARKGAALGQVPSWTSPLLRGYDNLSFWTLLGRIQK